MKQQYKPVKVPKICKPINQHFSFRNKVWYIQNLIEKAKDLPVFDMPMQCLNIYDLQPDVSSMLEFVKQVNTVMKADLKYPIILDEDGYVMDGRHRIAKALLTRKAFIKAVRFRNTPPPDEIRDES